MALDFQILGFSVTGDPETSFGGATIVDGKGGSEFGDTLSFGVAVDGAVRAGSAVAYLGIDYSDSARRMLRWTDSAGHLAGGWTPLTAGRNYVAVPWDGVDTPCAYFVGTPDGGAELYIAVAAGGEVDEYVFARPGGLFSSSVITSSPSLDGLAVVMGVETGGGPLVSVAFFHRASGTLSAWHALTYDGAVYAPYSVHVSGGNAYVLAYRTSDAVLRMFIQPIDGSALTSMQVGDGASTGLVGAEYEAVTPVAFPEGALVGGRMYLVAYAAAAAANGVGTISVDVATGALTPFEPFEPVSFDYPLYEVLRTMRVAGRTYVFYYVQLEASGLSELRYCELMESGVGTPQLLIADGDIGPGVRTFRVSEEVTGWSGHQVIVEGRDGFAVAGHLSSYGPTYVQAQIRMFDSKFAHVGTVEAGYGTYGLLRVVPGDLSVHPPAFWQDFRSSTETP